MPRQCPLLLLALLIFAGCRTPGPTTPPTATDHEPPVQLEDTPPPAPPPATTPRQRASTFPPPRATPAPAAARPAIEVLRLQPGVWRHTSRDAATGKPSHGLVVQEQQRLVLVDTPVSAAATAELLDWAEREQQQPISRAILTHVEPNGLAGARLLDEQRIPLLTLTATGAHLLSQGGPRTTNVGDVAPGGSVRVGSVELYYPGLEHRRDAVLVWLRDARVLYGGCAIKPVGALPLETMSAHERQVWAAAVRRVMQRYAEVTIVVPMEGEPGGPDLLHHTLRLLAAATP